MKTSFKLFHSWRTGSPWPAHDGVSLRATVVMVMESVASFLDQWALTAQCREKEFKLRFDTINAHTQDHESRLVQLEKLAGVEERHDKA